VTRPINYTDDLCLRICARVANGEILTSICEDGDMPDRETVIDWIRGGDHESFVIKAAWAVDERKNNAIVRTEGRGHEIIPWTPETAKADLELYRHLPAKLPDGTFADRYRRRRLYPHVEGEADIERMYRERYGSAQGTGENEA
jgi:hypothetical protein